MCEHITRAIKPDRRTFVKRLVLGTAFAVPAVATFKMTGIGAVFGDAPRAVTGGANGNTTDPGPPAKFPTNIGCYTILGKTGLDVTEVDGANTVHLVVPVGALPDGSSICIYKGDLGAIGADTPNATPRSAYAVVWHSPPGNSQPDATSPVTLTVTDPTVLAGDPLFMYDKSSGAIVSVGTAATAGSWTVTFVEDPGFVATSVPSGSSGGGTAAQAITAPAQVTG